jgi:hypothetical protein
LRRISFISNSCIGFFYRLQVLAKFITSWKKVEQFVAAEVIATQR